LWQGDLMNVFRSRGVSRWLALVAHWAAFDLVSGVAALAGDSDNVRRDREIRLPDSYLPEGFIRDKSSSSSRMIFSADGGGNDNTTYSINTTAWVSNQELSSRPGDENCPFGPGLFKELRPIRFGEAQGYWSVEQVQSTYLDVSCIFKSGPLVGYLCLHAKATHWNGRSPTVPRPSEGQVIETLNKFVAAYSGYVRDQKWMTASRVPPTQTTSDEARPQQPPEVIADGSLPPVSGIERASQGGPDRDPETVSVFAVGSVAVGALTALGAGLMMLGMGVTPGDVIDGTRELFGGGPAPEAAPREPLTEEQRGAAVRIWTEGWENVSAQEQELLRTSPEWLREAIKGKLPTETVEGYRRGWKEDVAGVVTPVLKVAQSGCDLAVGIFSKVSPGFGVSYTMFKNMAGGMSEGVHDWWGGRNDKGLVRNVAEGLTRGGIKGGVETAVDFTAGKLLGHAGSKYAMDPNYVGAWQFPWKQALVDVAPEYFGGQVGKYAVGAAGDAAVDWTDPPGSKHRPLRAEGFFDTTSPVEKDLMDGLLAPETWATSPVRPVPRQPYMAQNLVQ
jgi:hypothetical protein